MNKKILLAILILILILSIIMIFPNSITKNYNIPKLFALLIGGFLLLIGLVLNHKEIIVDKKDILIFIFLTIAFLSTCLSDNIKISILGDRNRYEGFLMITIYVVIYIVAKNFIDFSKINKLLNIGFYVALFAGILGILQKNIDLEVLYPIFNKGIASTFGNSNFFGSFISIILPISSLMYIIYGYKKGYILSLVMFFNMIASGTRSAWVAFIIAALFGFIYLIKSKNKMILKNSIILIISFILIFAYLYCNGGIFKANHDTRARIKQIQSEFNSVKYKGISNTLGSNRIEIWKMTLKLIAQKPLFGCGTDNLKRGLLKYCREDFFAFAIRTSGAPDKAHNEYLQIAATMGIPAVIVYTIFVSAILLPKMKNMFKNKVAYILSLTIISYLTQAFFNISTIGVAPLYWMLLGITDRYVDYNKEEIIKKD